MTDKFSSSPSMDLFFIETLIRQEVNIDTLFEIDLAILQAESQEARDSAVRRIIEGVIKNAG